LHDRLQAPNPHPIPKDHSQAPRRQAGEREEEDVTPDLSTIAAQRAHYAGVCARLRPSGPEPVAPSRSRTIYLRSTRAASGRLPYVIIRRPSPSPFMEDPLLPPAPWKTIVREVAEKHGFAPEDIVGASRAPKLCVARHEAMWRMSREAALSTPEIGRRLGGRDHTTVLHGITTHEARIEAPRTRDVIIVPSSLDQSDIAGSVIEAVAAKHMLTVPQIMGTQHSSKIGVARQEIYHLLYTCAGMSMSQIGRAVGGRDHGSVSAGLKAYRARMDHGAAPGAIISAGARA
jgi:hypothetical protein